MTILQVVGGYKHRVSAVNWDNWHALLVWHGDFMCHVLYSGPWQQCLGWYVIFTYFKQKTRSVLSVAGPRIWNSLPASLRQPDIEFGHFKRLLKAFLFARLPRISDTLISMRHISQFTYLLTFLLSDLTSVYNDLTSVHTVIYNSCWWHLQWYLANIGFSTFELLLSANTIIHQLNHNSAAEAFQ